MEFMVGKIYGVWTIVHLSQLCLALQSTKHHIFFRPVKKKEIFAYSVAHISSINKIQLQKHSDESPRQQPVLD